MRVHFRTGSEVETLEHELFASNDYFPGGIAIRDGAIVCDVGANIGMFVLLLASKLKKAQVFAFEPIPDTFEVLRLNAREALGIDVLPLNYGLSRQAQAVEFAHFPRSSVMSSMYFTDSVKFRMESREIIKAIMRQRGGLTKLLADYAPAPLLTCITETVRRYYHKSIQVRCRLRTRSEFLDETRVPRIDLLKIDAEGAEFDVLAGIRDEHWALVQQTVIEVHGGADKVEKALAILRERGFEAWSAPTAWQSSLLAMVYARRSPGIDRACQAS